MSKTKKQPSEEHLSLSTEEIEKRQKDLEKQIENLKAEKSLLGIAKRGKSNKDRTRVAIVGNFLRNKRTEVYNEIITCEEFDKYLNRNKDRELFGLPLLPEEQQETNIVGNKVEVRQAVAESAIQPDKQQAEMKFQRRPEGGFYLNNIHQQYAGIPKKMGAEYDSTQQKWYAPSGVNPEAIQRAVDEAIETDKRKTQVH